MEYHYAEKRYADCHVLYNVMPNVVMLSVIMLSVVGAVTNTPTYYSSKKVLVQPLGQYLY